MVKRKRSCSALHLFACFGAKSGANVSTGSQGGLRALGICRQCSVSRDVGGEVGADASIRSNISLGANVSTGSQGGLRTLGICRQSGISRDVGGEAGADACWVRTRTRAGHSLGVAGSAAACLGAMIGKKQSGGLVGSSGMAAFCYDGGNIACNISGISTKAPCETPAMHDRHGCKGIYDSVLHAFVRTIRALMVSARPKRPDGAGISV